MYSPRGMSLIDVIVGTAIMLLVFLALFGILQASLRVSMFVKSESTALAIANNQIEYIRSLPYASVGTVGGIPAGTIAQNATTTEDGIAYGVRTLVEYYDDPADGTGANDTNGLTDDYKKIKVIVTYYTQGNKARQIVLNTVVIPPGIETTTGGGTLQIIVVNATGSPVPGATVQITNASTSPTVNFTTFTNSLGIVSLPGAATSTQYAVVVSKAGYSTAQTYQRNTNNQNPTPGYLTVVQGQTTSATFAIDTLGQLTIQTFSPQTTGLYIDTFGNASMLSAQSNTTAAGNQLALTQSSGSYPSSGTATSIPISPSGLISWGGLGVNATTPSGTGEIVQVLDGNGNLIPDTVLPGNSAGFTSSFISISGISATTYPKLELKATLSTNSSSVTPSLAAWVVTYQYEPPLPNVSFTLTGAKTIGTTGAGAAIYKTTVSTSTGATASIPLSLEWDSYTPTISGYDVQDACGGAPPFALSPGAYTTESLILGSKTNNALLVTVTNSSGSVVPGATVTLTNSGYSSSVTSSSCGGAYFGNLTASSNYTVSVSASGYTSTNATNVNVSGQSFYGASA